MTPLDAIAANRFSFAIQHRARVDICQHVRGAGEIGPRWRRGSNTFRPDDWEEMWTGIATPCPDCGSTTGMTSWEHYGFCPDCGREGPFGDYDWWSLADVLRYRADEAAGLIEQDPPSLIVYGFDVMTVGGSRAFRAECARRRDEREPLDERPLAEKVAGWRAERAGYVVARNGQPLDDDACAHRRAGWERGARVWQRSLDTGMEVRSRG